MPRHSQRDHLPRSVDRSVIYVLTHGRAVLLIGCVVVVLGLISAAGLTWNENITDLLPRDDPVVSAFFRLADDFDAMDYLYCAIGPSGDGPEPTEDELIAFAGRFHQRLESSDYFEKIIYRWKPSEFHEALARVADHRASLFTEHDAAAVADKLSYEAIYRTMKNWKRALTESPAPFLAQSLYEDPLGINEIFVDKLHGLQALGASLAVHGGRLFSEDGKHLLVIARPRFPATDSHRAEELIEFLERVIEHLEENESAGRMRIAYFGGHRASLENARQIKGDIKFTITLSVAAIALLSFLVYRRPQLVLLTFLPVFFGGAFALGLLRWIDPFISAISVGCGSMLIGISVDYAIHVLYNADQIVGRENLRNEMARIMRRLGIPITISASTTLGAFGVLHLSIMPGYRDLGEFGVLGIVGAAACSMVVLPVLVTKLLRTAKRDPICRLPVLFPPLFRFTLQRRLPCTALLILLSLLAMIGLSRLRFEGDIQQLNSLSAETRRDWDRVGGIFGEVMSSTAFAVEAGTLEEALQMNETLAGRLGRHRQRGDVTAVNTIVELLPSRRAQTENRRRWASFWDNDRRARLRQSLGQACRELRMKPEAFDEFFRSLPGPMSLLTYDDCQQGLLGQLLANYVSGEEGNFVVLTSVKLQHADAFPAVLNDLEKTLPRIISYNGSSFVRHMVELIYGEMKRLGLITFGVILVILLLFVRRLNLLLPILVPLLVSLLWTLGWLGWLDIRLNLMNSAVAVFIFGLTVDYGIFLTLAMRRSNQADAENLLRTCGAISISALTTLCGMGALVFARHPALHSIGATALLGIGSGLIAVFTIIPLLKAVIVPSARDS